MNKRIMRVMFLACSLLTFDAVTFAQQVQGTTVTGAEGVTLTIQELLDRAALSPRPQGIKIREEMHVRNRRPAANAASPKVASYPKADQSGGVILNNTQTIHSNFLGNDADETPGITVVPPDAMGDVGPTQVCVATNNRFKWYNKPTVCETPLGNNPSDASAPLGGAQVSIYIDDFFSTVRNGADVTDPHVQYDRLSQRWFITAINTSPSSNRIMLAVSNSPTITDKSSFTFYFFSHDQGAAVGSSDRNQFCDYPTLGVDKHAVYLAGLIFNSTTDDFIGSSVYVIKKSSVTSGGPITFTAFRQVGTSSTNIFCAQGVGNDDPNATLGYYVGVSAANFGELNYLVISDPGGNPTLQQKVLNVPSTDFPIDVTALGSTQKLDAGDDRILNAHLVQNKVANTKSIWLSHNIGVLNTCASDPNATANRNGTRWYQLDISGTNLTLAQSGTLCDPTVSARNYWMGSIMASGQGHALVGATVAGSSARADAAIAGRYLGSAVGTLFSPVQATNTSFSYNQSVSEEQRWGDYSQTVLDPSDQMTLWTFQEYTSSNNIWGVRAIQVKAPPPAAVTNMTAITCTGDRTIAVTLNGTAGNNFAGYFDPGNDAGGPGYAKRLTVTSTGNVTITNLQFVNPTQLTFTLDYSAATLGSQQTLTITNPDCQSVTFNYTLPEGCNALPARWLSVKADWQGNAGIVSWEVAAESTTVRYYEVERSADGRNFTPIGRVDATGALKYSFADNQPGEVNYYRIKQVEADGRFNYSPLAALLRSGADKISLFPNPAKDQVSIVLPAANGTIRMVSVAGAVVWSTNVSSNLVNVDTRFFARGLYIIEYETPDGGQKQEKLVLR